MFVATLVRNVNFIFYNQPGIPVYATVNIPVTGGHWRNSVFIVAAIVSRQNKQVILTEPDEWSKIEIKRSESALVISNIFAVKVDAAIFLHTIKFYGHLSIRQSSDTIKCFL